MGDQSELVVRKDEPQNLESPCSIFDSYLTPEHLFYVRNHFPMPRIELDTWRLRVEGCVEQVRDFTYAEILAMPARTVVATLECAGNSRAFLPEPSKGVQWKLGAVGNAEWTGVPLSELLARAGLEDRATDIVLEGADAGEIAEEPKTPGIIRYARSLPLSKAVSSDVLVAYRMNGRELSPEHGFPVRAVVPGWYGMASVKWLERILVSDRAFGGYFETFEYSRWERRDGMATLVPLRVGEVKAEIAAPAASSVLKTATACRIHGAAWAGESEISAVEVSVDNGRTWNRARLLDTPRSYCWVRWDYSWTTPPQSSRATLLAKATAKDGRSQPFEHREDDRHYAVHEVLRIPVEVK